MKVASSSPSASLSWCLSRSLLLLLMLLLLSTTAAATTAAATTATTTTATNSRRTTDAPPAYPRQYELLLPEEIPRLLNDWKDRYPQFVSLTSSQEAYGLPRTGTARDCPFDAGGDGCLHHVLTIQDYTVHRPGTASSNQLPEVFWSGALHGNERVGPTAVVEAAHLLLQAAACEALPVAQPTSPDYPRELQQAKFCRSQLASQGVSNQHRQWLARLVATRRIVVVPTANALGYFRNVREEETMDPNRDFPYDVLDPTECFKTIAARTLNEIFREHIFQLSLTFHGGTEVIGYEWGAPTYLHKDSPDEVAQHAIAQAYSNYGAGWSNSRQYDYGNMNDKVYYVRGGFEDWAYAGSWDSDRVIQCQPSTYGVYPKEKSTYSDSTLRVFNMLIETSNDKIPHTSELGTSEKVLERTTPGNGHVSRNIRLSLLAADLVQPYVSVVGVHNFALSEDYVPMAPRTCDDMPVIMIPKNLQELQIEWSVGGALSVDDTTLWFAKDTEEARAVLDCISQPDTATLQSLFTMATPHGATNGTAYFSSMGPIPHPSISKTDIEPALGPIFSATLGVSEFKPLERLLVVATARVDQSWTDTTHNVGPAGLAPQAHIVQARTNPNWHHESNNKVVQGRLDWWSMPVAIVVGEYDDSVGNQEGREISIVETTNRFGETHGHAVGGVSPSRVDHGTNKGALIGGTVALVLLGVAGIFMMRARRAYSHRQVLNELYADDGIFRDGYHDDDDSDEDEEDRDLELTTYKKEHDNADPLGSDSVADMKKFSII